MVEVILKDILKDKSFPDGGTALFDIAKNVMNDNGIVYIDMIGVDYLPTFFMNTSFGELINLYGYDKTRQAFLFTNISKSQLERLGKYFKDYKNLLDKNSNIGS